MYFDITPDDEFIKTEKVPGPTKEEIRALVISKTSLTDEDVVIDVGCGTGGLTLEFAKRARKVYSIDMNPEAIQTTRCNLEKFGLQNKEELIENKFGNNIDIIKMLDTDKENSRIWLTINPKNINKLNTLKNICNSINCSMNEVLFFGDGENDLILIENAGIGIAMDNALNIVKEKANYITLSNDNDGIAEYIENNF